MPVRTLTTHEGADAYVLTVGPYTDRTLFGVMVGVTAEQADAFAHAESARRAHDSTLAVAHAVRVESTPVYAPEPVRAGQMVTGAECDALPPGSIVQRVRDTGPRTGPRTVPLVRIADGEQRTPRWVTVSTLAEPIASDYRTTAPDGRYLVLYAAGEDE